VNAISEAVVPRGLASFTSRSLRFACCTFRFTVASATVNVSLTTNERTTPVAPTPHMLAAVGALIVGFFLFDAKFWGVVGMGVGVLVFFSLPWVDNSPVKSIRYRPGWHKYMYAMFVVVFVILGYFGVQAPSPVGERISQACTLLYLAFFMFMPWWSAMGEPKPVPERVTFAPH